MKNREKTVAVICEYNPFHFGHKYQIDRLKEEFDAVVGIMSGPFVQRGDVAVADKYRRAAAALKGGLDLVLELPFPYCVSAGRDFATAGVRLAAALGADALAFGCENSCHTLQEIAALISTPDFDRAVAKTIKASPSLSYHRARARLVGDTLGSAAEELMSKPNNILAIEYMAAINRDGLPTLPFPVQRSSRFKSATEIRSAEGFEGLIPFEDCFKDPRRELKYMERAIISMLRQGPQGEFYAVDKGLYAAIKAAALKSTSLEELIERATGKTYTAARVRRAIIAMWLGIKADAVKAPPTYTTLLATNAKGQAFLRANKKGAAFPVITKPSAYTELDAASRAAAEVALRAEEQAALCVERLMPYTSPLTAVPTVKKADKVLAFGGKICYPNRKC